MCWFLISEVNLEFPFSPLQFSKKGQKKQSSVYSYWLLVVTVSNLYYLVNKVEVLARYSGLLGSHLLKLRQLLLLLCSSHTQLFTDSHTRPVIFLLSFLHHSPLLHEGRLGSSFFNTKFIDFSNLREPFSPLNSYNTLLSLLFIDSLHLACHYSFLCKYDTCPYEGI